jgi:hypothetical protein
MATPQLSPGVLVREVDLTVGRANNVLDNIGAIAGPFPVGPVEEAIDITTEQELIDVFGKPLSLDGQYEYWMSASSYLSYGGVLKVVRVDDADLRNANVLTVGIGSTADLKIKNFDDYNANHSDDIASYIFAAKNPGSRYNDLKVAVIDNRADQIVNIGTAVTQAVVGYGVSVALTNEPLSGVGETSLFTGYLKGIITGVGTGTSTIDVKFTSRFNTTTNKEEFPGYSARVQTASIRPGNTVAINNAGAAVVSVAVSTAESTVSDWYDQQSIILDNGNILWSSIAPKPGTSQYAVDRNSTNDEIHVAVIDDIGTITGIKGNLLEKFVGLSKATDSVSAINSPQRIWWKEYLAQNSKYLYVGDNPSDDSSLVAQTGFSTEFAAVTLSGGQWNKETQDVTFSALGNKTYTLTGGKDYSSGTPGKPGTMKADLGSLATAYDLFGNKDEIAVDYLIMGPGLGTTTESASKASKLISIAQSRKDCVAVISPHRYSVVSEPEPGSSTPRFLTTNDQTKNIINFFGQIGNRNSSYAIFDSGYKYTFDRFNNRFRYIPCNADVAGLCVRTSIQSYPWFSPAGQQRGVLNNAIKLAYNPNKAQRDQLYPLGINPIVNQPGSGILLFGDKTALGYASAFDRINVRRLFLTVEQALQDAAEAQLFELNDQITRANFVNIVEPYLRDVKAKRGVYDFLVICDETNNTPDVIDNNEFRADIFLKPTKSINYVTLTFVATRTGISFEEVAGRV